MMIYLVDVQLGYPLKRTSRGAHRALTEWIVDIHWGALQRGALSGRDRTRCTLKPQRDISQGRKERLMTALSVSNIRLAAFSVKVWKS